MAHMLPFSPRRHQQPPWGHTWTKCSQRGSFQTQPTWHLSGQRVARRLRLWVLFPICWVIWVRCVISASQFLSHEMNLLNQPVPKLFRGVKSALIFWSWLCLQLLICRMGDSELPLTGRANQLSQGVACHHVGSRGHEEGEAPTRSRKESSAEPFPEASRTLAVLL